MMVARAARPFTLTLTHYDGDIAFAVLAEEADARVRGGDFAGWRLLQLGLHGAPALRRQMPNALAFQHHGG